MRACPRPTAPRGRRSRCRSGRRSPSSSRSGSWSACARRFDFEIPRRYEELIAKTIVLVVVLKVGVFVLFGFYNHWWRYVSIRDIWSAARGVVVASLLVFVVIFLIDPVDNVRLPRSVIVVDMLLLLAFITGTRLLARTIMERPSRRTLVTRG